jgi:hypothetical protein
MKKIKLVLALTVSAIYAGPTFAQSVIPYSFKDGQVISADTFNDLFATINLGAGGLSNKSELAGTWSCRTYDISGQSPTSGMPNDQFSPDATTGLYTIEQTWTISADGATVEMDKLHLGGVAGNNTGGCAGQSTYDYTVNLLGFGLYVGLTGANGCTIGNGYVAAVRRTSVNDFVIPFDTYLVQCESASPVPDAPTDLTATAGGGVTLSWTAPNAGTVPSSYKILKKTNGTFSQVGTTTSTTYSDANGQAGEMYRVKSSHSNGDSLGSAVARAE